jgi:hypothetical protein
MAIEPGSQLQTPGVTKTVADILIDLKPTVTMIKQFAYDLSPEVADFGARVRLPLMTAGEVEEYNDDNCSTPGNYGNFAHVTGGLSQDYVELGKPIKVTIPITQTDRLEMPGDPFWTRCTEVGANAISKAISKKIGSLFTAENCQAGKITMAGVSTAEIAQLRTKAAKKGRVSDYVVVLNGEYYADFLSVLPSNVYGSTDPIQDGVVEKIYGFKSVVCAEDLPEGIKGVLVPASGVAVAGRPLAIPDPQAYTEFGTVSDENGFAITAFRFTDFPTAKCLFNVSTMVGAKIIRPADTYYISAS